jgi:hypothetical protein
VSGMRQGFHAHSGWYFRRDHGGHVVVEVAESDHVDAPLRVVAVASVSAAGETAETWHAARDLHSGAAR